MRVGIFSLTKKETEKTSSVSYTGGYTAAAGESVTLLNVTGRGRLKAMAIYMNGLLSSDIKITIIVDGTTIWDWELNYITSFFAPTTGVYNKPFVMQLIDDTNKKYILIITAELAFSSSLQVKLTNKHATDTLTGYSTAWVEKYKVT